MAAVSILESRGASLSNTGKGTRLPFTDASAAPPRAVGTAAAFQAAAATPPATSGTPSLKPP